MVKDASAGDAAAAHVHLGVRVADVPVQLRMDQRQEAIHRRLRSGRRRPAAALARNAAQTVRRRMAPFQLRTSIQYAITSCQLIIHSSCFVDNG